MVSRWVEAGGEGVEKHHNTPGCQCRPVGIRQLDKQLGGARISFQAVGSTVDHIFEQGEITIRELVEMCNINAQC